MGNFKNTWFLSILSGLLLALAWPEIGGWEWVIFIAFVPLLSVEQRISEMRKREKFLNLFPRAYLGFFIFNLLTSWWIYYASAFGVVMAVVFNSLFMSIVFVVYHKIKFALKGNHSAIILVCLWSAWEYFHMQWDLSWPWLNLGNVFAQKPHWIQWYEYLGTSGGTMWVLLVNCAFMEFLRSLYSVTGKASGKWGIIALSAIIIPVGFSLMVYFNYEEEKNPVEVVVVQPNIDPYEDKFSGMTAEEQVSSMILLADSAATKNTDFVVFPETSLPRTIWEGQFEVNAEIGQLLSFLNEFPKSVIIAGVSYARLFDANEELSPTVRQLQDGRFYDYYNSAMLVSQRGVKDLYHKSKLVVGVEKMPFPQIFKYLDNFALDLGGITGSLGVQEERSVFTGINKNMVLAPVICYESVYGEYVTGYIKNGAQIICIITNDGWWDDTPGYRQHLAYARLRAIETRRPVVRSANTGISASINQRGDITASLNWWTKGAINSTVNANQSITFYVMYGDIVSRVGIFMTILLILYAIVQKVTGKIAQKK